MRVALVSDGAGALAASGDEEAIDGRRRHVAELAAGLARQGHQVVVYTCGVRPGVPEELPSVGFDVVHLPTGARERSPAGAPPPYLGDFGDFLAERWRADPPDLAHAHAWTSGVASVLAASVADLPVVQTYHALGAAPAGGGGAEPPAAPPRLRFERMLGRRVAHVLATCTGEGVDLSRMGVPRFRITVVPWGVDLSRFTPDGPVAPRPMGHRLVAAGPLIPSQGFDTVISALRLVPGAELLIAGGPEPGRLAADAEASRLAGHARAERVADRVRLLGRVPTEDMPSLLRSADAVVCAPWYEPFGAVALEAMACGVPVVATAVGGLADAVVDEVTGLHVPPRRPDLVARVVRALLADSGLRFALGVAGHDRAHSRYSWDRIAADTASVYRRVIAGGGARPGGR